MLRLDGYGYPCFYILLLEQIKQYAFRPDRFLLVYADGTTTMEVWRAERDFDIHFGALDD